MTRDILCNIFVYMLELEIVCDLDFKDLLILKDAKFIISPIMGCS